MAQGAGAGARCWFLVLVHGSDASAECRALVVQAAGAGCRVMVLGDGAGCRVRGVAAGCWCNVLVPNAGAGYKVLVLRFGAAGAGFWCRVVV